MGEIQNPVKPGKVGIYYRESFAVNVQADKDAYFVDGLARFVQIVKAAGAGIADQYIEKLNILEGFSEPVKKGGTGETTCLAYPK
jgi:hypothetical protein